MHYRVLGTTQAVHDDGTPVALGGARLRALVAVLALRAGRTVPVGVLVDEVWDGDPPADAVGAVQALVGRARRALGRGAVVSADGGYRLCADADDVDLHRFERLAGEGARVHAGGDPGRAAELLDEALSLWRGPVLADLPGRTTQAARWETRRLDARRTRLAAVLALGRTQEVLPQLAVLCDEYPLDERLQALRIRALRAEERPAEALAAYESVRRDLSDRLGTDPGPELRTLHAELLNPEETVPARAPGPSRAPAPGNLRARLTSFVGREADIEVIRADLGRARLVTLLGPGGAGKTRLSQEAAEQAAGAYADGVWLVELAPVGDPANVPDAVLSALGARETVLRGTGSEELRAATEPHGDDPLVRLTEHCARRRMLIVLDNCEHVVTAAAVLCERLLELCPGLTVLATSREPLGVPGESIRPVGPLPAPMALRLFADRGAAANPAFRVDADAATAAASAEICRRLDGLPLAIELAAARLRMLSARQIADRLDDRFRLLSSGSRTVLPRQQTLRAVVDWSWELLDAPERTVLRRLAVFARGCALEGAEAVCAVTAPPASHGASVPDTPGTPPASGSAGWPADRAAPEGGAASRAVAGTPRPAEASGRPGSSGATDGFTPGPFGPADGARPGGPAVDGAGPDSFPAAGTGAAEVSGAVGDQRASGAVGPRTAAPGAPGSRDGAHGAPGTAPGGAPAPAPVGPAGAPRAGSPVASGGQAGAHVARTAGSPGGSSAATAAHGPANAHGAVVDARDVVSLLGALVDKSLVVAVLSADGGMRYQLLETVGEYAAERLDEAGDRADAERAHLVYYRELARRTDPLLRGPGQIAAIAVLEREQENMRTALRRACAAHDEDEALCLVLSLAWYWQMRDLRPMARYWARAVAELGPDPFAPPLTRVQPMPTRVIDAPPPLESERLLEARRGVRLIGMVSMEHGVEVWTSPERLEWLRGVAEVYRPGLPQTCRFPGLLWFYAVLLTGEGDQLMRALDKTVRACEEFGHEWDLAAVLQLRANVLANRSEWAGDATADADRGLEIFERHGDLWGTAGALSARGEAREKSGEFILAAEDFTAAIDCAVRLGADSQVPLLRARLASMLTELGRRDEAEAILNEVLKHADENAHEAVSTARLFLSLLLGLDGRTAEARAQLDLLSGEFESETLAIFEGFRVGGLAWLDCLDGRYDDALTYATRALKSAMTPLSQLVAPHMAAAHLLSAAEALVGLGEETAHDGARLLGAYRNLLPVRHFRTTLEREGHDRAERAARAALGDEVYETRYAEGGRLTLEEAAALVRAARLRTSSGTSVSRSEPSPR
ncbi:BTAD domain-containing putative transcriptional regulator [Streptomyces sp. NPDC057445]|uniref:BTAD domain-containing putative transcriptional regulator n=1 Tax=Streptomyces sp. NPDC057445 TaxID=3346136 RepID=UPI0036945B09